MKKRAIADSGFLYAIINKKDSQHERAKLAAKKHDRQWVTTCFVFQEVFFLLSKPPRNIPHLIPNFFKMVTMGILEILEFQNIQIRHLEAILEKYPKLDLADASLVLLAEDLGQGDIFTVDFQDFSFCRWAKSRHFNILVDR